MSNLGSFIWSIADQLRGVYRPAQYGNVILPFTILRRLDAQIAEHRDTMHDLAARHANPEMLARQVKKQIGLQFYAYFRVSVEAPLMVVLLTGLPAEPRHSPSLSWLSR